MSDIPGTTTDPVRKAMEIPGIGPCVFTDTAGFDDDAAGLGEKRTGLTLNQALVLSFRMVKKAQTRLIQARLILLAQALRFWTPASWTGCAPLAGTSFAPYKGMR